MEYALSMYLGGVTIKASEANYKTSRKLGCLCPSCKEAVFLRAGSTRHTTLRNGKKSTQAIKAAFVHYGGEENDDCEKRSRTLKVKQEMKKYEGKGRDQRLALFNSKLYDLFYRGRLFETDTKEALKFIKKILGDKTTKEHALRCRSLAKRKKEKAHFYMQSTLEVMRNPSETKEMIHKNLAIASNKNNLESTIDEEDILLQHSYFKAGCDSRLHIEICHEIWDFLGTKKADYFWRKFIVVLFFMHITVKNSMNTETDLYRELETYKGMFKSKDDDYLLELVSVSISSTHWIEAINEILGFVGNKTK